MRRGVVTLLVLAFVAVACGGDSTPAGDAATTEAPNADVESAASTTGETAPPAGEGSTSTEASSPAGSAATEEATSAPGTEATNTPSTEAGGTPGSPPSDDDGSEAVTGSDESSGHDGEIDEGLRPFIDMAIADLAARLGIGASAISVVSARLVVWPNAALGCPQPGMSYAQVAVDGSLIELEAGGLYYRYHTGGNTFTPFLCTTPDKTDPPVTDLGIGDDEDY